MTDTPKKLLYTFNTSIRWADMDALGHVNNVVYFVYMQETRAAWIKMLEIPITCVVAKTDCAYLLPITFPADISVALYSSKVGRSSFVLYYEIYAQNDPKTIYAHGHSTMVWIDTVTGRSVPIPDFVRQQLEFEPT